MNKLLSALIAATFVSLSFTAVAAPVGDAPAATSVHAKSAAKPDKHHKHMHKHQHRKHAEIK